MTKFRVKYRRKPWLPPISESMRRPKTTPPKKPAEQAREQGGDHIWKYDGLIEDAPITATL